MRRQMLCVCVRGVYKMREIERISNNILPKATKDATLSAKAGVYTCVTT